LLKGNGFLVSGVVGRKAKILYIYRAALGGLRAPLRPLAQLSFWKCAWVSWQI
jgi:hypothetical protein